MRQRISAHRLVVRGLGIAAAGLLALVIAACGSGASTSSTTKTTDNGVSSESASQVVSSAQSAMRSANGFVMAGTLTQAGHQANIHLVDDGSSKLKMHLTEGATSIDIIISAKAGYVRANHAYWAKKAGAEAAHLANRWIAIPASASGQLISGLGAFAPNNLSMCLGQDLGTVSLAGKTTIGGKSAVVVHDAGNVPGGSPGTLAVASTGPAYPLRVTATGRTRPGGKVDACNDGKGGDSEGSLTLSDFNHAPDISAPAHPLKLSDTPKSSV